MTFSKNLKILIANSNGIKELWIALKLRRMEFMLAIERDEPIKLIGRCLVNLFLSVFILIEWYLSTVSRI